MGFGDDTQVGQSAANTLLEKQITQNEAEIESKRKSLYDERLSIVKSSGRENWGNPQSSPSAPKPTELGKM